MVRVRVRVRVRSGVGLWINIRVRIGWNRVWVREYKSYPRWSAARWSPQR